MIVNADGIPTLLRQDFEESDGTTASSLGWSSVSGSFVVDTGALLAQSSTSRISRDLGARIDRGIFSVTGSEGNNAAVNVRYQDADNFIRIRWNHSSNVFEIDKVVGGVVTQLDSVSTSGVNKAGEYHVEVRDTGTDIIATVMGFNLTVSASNGAWSNEFADETGLALFASSGNGFRSIIIYDGEPAWNATTHPEPMWGAYEKSRHSVARYSGTHDRTYFTWMTPWGDVCIQRVRR